MVYLILSAQISIIMPAFNAGATIEMALLSIIRQEAAPSFEVLVIDDSSTDNTQEVVKALMAEYPSIKLFSNAHTKGPSGARNTGLDAATGDFIAFLDSDDTWYPMHLNNAMRLFTEHTDADVLIQNFDIYSDAKKEFVGNWFAKKPNIFPSAEQSASASKLTINVVETLFSNSFLHLQAVVMRKPDSAIRFDESLTRAEDRDFFIQRFTHNDCGLFVNPTITGTYFLRGGSLTAKEPAALIKTELALVKFYDKYLHSADQQPQICDIIKVNKAESCYELSYLHRQQKALGKAMTHSLNGLQTRWSKRQLVELCKVLASFLRFSSYRKS